MVWTLRLADLGLARPATIRLRVVSSYKSYTGLGVLVDYTDVAGPGSVAVAGPPKVGGPSRACASATSLVNRLARQIKSATKATRRGRRAARRAALRRLRKLRAQRTSALKTVKRKCAAPVRGPAPTSAPAGCRLVTKPVFVLEGTGSNSKYVLREQVVVECTR